MTRFLLITFLLLLSFGCLHLRQSATTVNAPASSGCPNDQGGTGTYANGFTCANAYPGVR